MNLHKGMSRTEIERFLAGKGDFIQIDYLTRFVKEDIGIEMKKFVYLKLIDLYQKTNMFVEAAKLASWIGDNSINYADKRKWYITEFELCVKAHSYGLADQAIKKAITDCTFKELREIKEKMKSVYLRTADEYENKQRRGQAVQVYEKLMTLDLSSEDKMRVKEKLLKLYNDLGKIKEYSMLKGSGAAPSSTATQKRVHDPTSDFERSVFSLE